jgi:hypothetical protein
MVRTKWAMIKMNRRVCIPSAHHEVLVSLELAFSGKMPYLAGRERSPNVKFSVYDENTWMKR